MYTWLDIDRPMDVIRYLYIGAYMVPYADIETSTDKVRYLDKDGCLGLGMVKIFWDKCVKDISRCIYG